MPSLIAPCSSRINGEHEDLEKKRCGEAPTIIHDVSPTRKRRSRSGDLVSSPSKQCSPTKWKSPRRSATASPKTPMNCSPSKWKSPRTSKDGIVNGSVVRVSKSPRKRLADSFPSKPKWNPKGRILFHLEQISAVKEALHVSTAPSAILCREDEQTRLLEFCTGKTLSVEKVKELLLNWVKEAGHQKPDVLSINCTSLTSTSEIFMHQLQKKTSSSSSPLQQLQKLFSQKKQASNRKMMLIIADEMDYLITKDCSVLHELFLLTSLPSSRCIIIGVANAIDLASRFLPKLQSLNWRHVLHSGKPMVLTFRAYSKDHILRILRQRLMVLPYDVFQEEALELCARKIAAASGDMRKALFVCRSAVEMLEAEVVDSSSKMCLVQANGATPDQSLSRTIKLLVKDENTVRIDHMAVALSKTFKSPIVDTVQSLPQHQQMVLCSIVKLFQRSKKDTTIAELNRSYSEICKSVVIPPASALEFSTMCKVLSDQGLFKLGQSREDRLKRVTLKVDEAEIGFALQGIRLFRNCLQ
ncbi:hypothetical protein Sjap_014062 [Stephania japonica]|uniref:Cell division control protein n=1 Tax=Stephania japonica TaxID=461633 RepID=A0AAP0IZW5_9MAGN